MVGKDAIQKLSRRGAIGLLVVFSVVGWLAIGFLFTAISPDDASQVAEDGEAKTLQQFAPAAGPKKTPETKAD